MPIRTTMTLALLAAASIPACAPPPPPPVDDPRFAYLGQTEVLEESTSSDTTTWTFDPSSGPICMRGDVYRASVRETGSENLLIFLQGGGACWGDFCLAVTAAPEGIPLVDVLDPSIEANPFADWNVAYLPYCDGSVFVGDREHDEDGDGSPDRIHRGLANLSAGLDVARQTVPDPTRIVFAGSSGGGFGALLAPSLVRHVYPDAELAILSDSAAGVGRGNVEPGFVQMLVEQWGAAALLPPDCPDCIDNGHMTDLIAHELERHPNVRMAIFSAWYDQVMSDLFLDIPPEQLRDSIAEQTTALHERFPDRYRRFLIDGRMHTTLLGDPTGIIGTNLGAVELPPGVLATLSEIDLGSLDSTVSAEGHEIATWIDAFAQGDTQAWTDVVDPAGAAPE